MSKVKQWAEDTAEKSVDLILKKLKDGQIDLDNATTNILDVENVNMLGIDENNVDENYVENYITKFVDNYYKNNSLTETHKLLTSYNSYEKYIREPTSKDLKSKFN